MRKSIISGIICGVMLISTVAGAKTLSLDGYLETRNPIYSAPQGRASTYGYKTCTAQVKATKNGTTNSQKKSGTEKAITSWVSGPTYTSSGTTFSSTHTGYDYWGNYTVKYASYKY